LPKKLCGEHRPKRGLDGNSRKEGFDRKCGLRENTSSGPSVLHNPHPHAAVECAGQVNQERADAYANNLNSLRGIAQCLNARGFETPNGKAFAAQSVKNLLDRASRSRVAPV